MYVGKKSKRKHIIIKKEIVILMIKRRAYKMGLLLLFHVLLVAMVAKNVPCTHAWGKDGHYMVCKVAEVMCQITLHVLDHFIYMLFIDRSRSV